MLCLIKVLRTIMERHTWFKLFSTFIHALRALATTSTRFQGVGQPTHRRAERVQQFGIECGSHLQTRPGRLVFPPKHYYHAGQHASFHKHHQEPTRRCKYDSCIAVNVKKAAQGVHGSERRDATTPSARLADGWHGYQSSVWWMVVLEYRSIATQSHTRNCGVVSCKYVDIETVSMYFDSNRPR